MADSRRNCELCNGEAAIYCPSDSAFLCRSCDSKVHGANFLVARHIRSSICLRCRNLDGHRFSGVRISSPARNTCLSCSPETSAAGDLDPLSSSSSCVSSTGDGGDDVEAMTSRKSVEKVRAPVAVDLRVEGILVNWCRRIGLEDVDIRGVISTAMDLLGVCMDKMTVLPFRVFLAAAFWVALRLCHRGGCSTCQDLERVEQISGVPAKLILATESRVARALKRRRSREDREEGSAEC